MVDVPFMVKVLRGHASQEEREFLDAWLKESDAHREEFAAVAETWEKTGRTGIPAVPDPLTQWAILESRLTASAGVPVPILPDHAPVRLSEGKRRRLRVFRSIGVGMLLLAAMAGLTTGIFWLAGRSHPAAAERSMPDTMTGSEREYTTANGRRAMIPLPDGTVVHLNAASRLWVDPAFGGTERRVVLEGEAYFAVASDPSKPFRVYTGASFTEVRGTEFGVRYRRDKIDVVVSRGKVRVVSRSKGGSVDLERGEGVTATASGELSKPHRVDLHESLAWRENRMAFKKTPLEDVMTEIEEVYDLHVEFKTPAARSRTLTGTFSVDSIDVVLSQIALAMDLSIHRDGRTVVVR
jgi:ferric-dicitrate binding protein FerR (iron transport regulator)